MKPGALRVVVLDSSLTPDAAPVAEPPRAPSRWALPRAMARARALTSPDHILTVVAGPAPHRWGPALDDVSPAHLIVQPVGRDTGVGLLAALLRVCREAPAATVLILDVAEPCLPAAPLLAAVESARAVLAHEHHAIALVGEHPRDEDGRHWIVPGPPTERGAVRVERFAAARPGATAGLRHVGAVWRTGCIAAQASALFRLYRRVAPRLLHAFVRLLGRRRSPLLVEEFFGALPSSNLWQDLLAPATVDLRLAPLEPSEPQRPLLQATATR